MHLSDNDRRRATTVKPSSRQAVAILGSKLNLGAGIASGLWAYIGGFAITLLSSVADSSFALARWL